eukprot:GHVS01005605.1.p3 GENE.GHVS01005605.1~~GHVS01005605.1.p3  ORF type:complete len:112 (+),score=22.49 GHVS01005605.1:272-607(+)
MCLLLSMLHPVLVLCMVLRQLRVCPLRRLLLPLAIAQRQPPMRSCTLPPADLSKRQATYRIVSVFTVSSYIYSSNSNCYTAQQNANTTTTDGSPSSLSLPSFHRLKRGGGV